MKEKLRVAMVTRFPYTTKDGFSGLLQVSQNLCNALAQRDDIELVVVSGTDHVQRVERRSHDRYSVIFVPYHSHSVQYASFYTRTAWSLRNELWKLRPDIIHCQATAETAIAGIWAGLPLITTIHGLYGVESHSMQSWKAKVVARIQGIVEAWYVRRLRYIISCSPYVTRFVRAANTTASLYSISNPIDNLFFSSRIEENTPQLRSILLVGIVSYRKGHDLMVEALGPLVRRHSDVQLTIVGRDEDADFADAVKQQIERAGLSGNVRWLGPIPQDRLFEEMQRHQILCLPSREETLPMSISQAMAVGNVVVASTAGGIPDMLQDGVSGYLFRSGDAASLAEVLTRVFDTPPDDLNTMVRRNREYAEATYAAERVAEQTMMAYRRVLDAHQYHVATALRKNSL